MTKNKSKNRQCSNRSKWIESSDGTFSLVVESKKLIVSQETSNSEVNNNELEKKVTKGHSKKKRPEDEKTDFKNVPQQNGNSTSAIRKNSSINGISSSQLSIESDDLKQSDSITSDLNDDIAALQLTNGHTVEIPKKSQGSSANHTLNCAQSNAIEIESADSDDDSFYSNLFGDSKQTYVSAPTDTFPFNDDSDSEADVLHTVTFYIDDDQQPMAEFNDRTYRIGQLDLTPDEYSYLKMISEAPIQLDFNLSNVVMHHNRLCIKRIEDQQKTLISSDESHLWFEFLNLARIQFSVNEPFLAKYQNEIYFVGRKLCEEYMQLLLHTKKNPGTAIRLNKNRIVVDTLTRTLDVIESISIDRQSKVCIISGPNTMPKTSSRDASQYRRYIVNSNPCEILEVDQALLHSSEHDHCMEIYAGKDFPSISFGADRYETVANANENDNSDEKESGFEDDGPLKMMALKTYAVPDEIKMINRNRNLSKKELNAKFYQMVAKDQIRTKKKHYIHAYSTMIHLEEDEQARSLATFNEDNVQITYYMDRQFYFGVPNPELVGAIEENIVDRFVLKSKHENVKTKPKKAIWGQVLRVKDKKIYIEIFPESFKEVRNSHKSQLYEIIFTVNRVPFQLQHLALEFIKTDKLFPKLIRNKQYLKTDSAAKPNGKANPTLGSELSVPENMFGLNAEQHSAVNNIISKKDKLPFILFGPPGTGKTRTLVAAIEQIIRTTNQNVLVCAMSNAACDEIAERLIHVLDEKQMYRFYAKSFKNEKINGHVARNSNYSCEGIFYPSLKFLYQFRVFICTLASAGCLTRARIDEHWRPDHFGYVIIDEAASANECMCLIPIAGLCTSHKNIHAQIVLAGDPKQLDAVTKSEKAKALGYSTSWLEQLCNTNLYSRNATTGKFNESYITQLVKNYRSHPHILSVPNELFYENKLESCAAKSQINWYINSSFLPSKNFPVIFKSVQGSCKKSTEYSWYNDEEIDEVIKVIKQLMPRSQQKGLRQISQTDIGVVTPYRKQRNCLAQKLRRLNFDEITIGTAEVFQGKEKPVMIISTVRSNGQLGFVAEPRRLNVVITRAKCLIVIIGDPHTLKLDKNWSRVMQYCMENNSFLQSNKKFSLH